MGKGCRLWQKDLDGYRVIISRNVVFNETEITCIKDQTQNTESIDKDKSFNEIDLNLLDSNARENDQFEAELLQGKGEDKVPKIEENEPLEQLEPKNRLGSYQLSRVRKEIRPPVRFDEVLMSKIFLELNLALMRKP
ncbi:hypothetical protein Adt_23265 [Abeliophyllum distichum]|uniref:Uncharacterized protein n=1 Tax=Abeliophyllum distichum TaxID=126358 RepID=A0ABD1SAV3_9LAMI